MNCVIEVYLCVNSFSGELVERDLACQNPSFYHIWSRDASLFVVSLILFKFDMDSKCGTSRERARPFLDGGSDKQGQKTLVVHHQTVCRLFCC